jgi:hypothetical protein
MLSIATGPDLERRLAAIARRLGTSPAECALAALTVWIEDHEEAQANARTLGGGDGVRRMPEDFTD